MLVPQALKEGDRVAVVAPGSPLRGRINIEPAIRVYERAGFSVQMPRRRLCYAASRSAHVAGPAWARAAELNSALRDRRIRAVVCLRGGYGCMELLRVLDYGAAAADPKPVVGFSDATALLMAFYVRCGLATYHGPVMTTLAAQARENPDSASARTLLAALTGSQLLDLWDLSDSESEGGVLVISPGRAHGVLLGGNLSIMCALLGTSYFPDLRGCLLFLEEVGEPLYRVERMITQLELAGVLRSAAGVVLGQFTGQQDGLAGLLRRRFASLGIPVISGIVAGHGACNLTLAMGLPHLLDTEDHVFTCTRLHG